MKYIKTLVAAFAAVAFLTTAAYSATNTVTAADSQWNLSIAGTGATTTSTPNTTTAGLELGLGKTGNLVLPVEAGVRQTVNFSDVQGVSLTYSTKVYSDWTVLKLGNLDFAVGGNGGAKYGDTQLTWTVAPEAVVRLWLKKDVNVALRADYAYDITNGRFEKNVGYTLGFNVRF